VKIFSFFRTPSASPSCSERKGVSSFPVREREFPRILLRRHFRKPSSLAGDWRSRWFSSYRRTPVHSSLIPFEKEGDVVHSLQTIVFPFFLLISLGYFYILVEDGRLSFFPPGPFAQERSSIFDRILWLVEAYAPPSLVFPFRATAVFRTSQEMQNPPLFRCFSAPFFPKIIKRKLKTPSLRRRKLQVDSVGY